MPLKSPASPGALLPHGELDPWRARDTRQEMSSLRAPVAVLCSGGLDSAVLLVDMARTAGRAVPVFVRAGHVWEAAERRALARFVDAVGDVRIASVRD